MIWLYAAAGTIAYLAFDFGFFLLKEHLWRRAGTAVAKERELSAKTVSQKPDNTASNQSDGPDL